MVQIQGHKKTKRKRRFQKWPRKFIPKHTVGKCPYCKRRMKNIEAHIDEKHEFEKPKQIKGIVLGHD